MKIELRSIEAIRPYEGNPRVNDQAVDAVAKSLREFGFRQPIVVDGEGIIIVGHTRWKAAQKLGLKQVPVHVAKDLSPAQIKAYRIADNQTASLAEWNYDLLPVELRDIEGMNFDLSLLGFSDADLTEILAPPGNEGLTDPDDVPEPPDEAVTQPGDLWILGQHRLLCGDAGKAEDVDRLLDGACIHLVNTDPPYNVRVEPRSNNAIAAGLSSFPAAKSSHGGLMHHQSFDVARQGTKHRTTKKMRAKDRPLADDDDRRPLAREDRRAVRPLDLDSRDLHLGSLRCSPPTTWIRACFRTGSKAIPSNSVHISSAISGAQGASYAQGQRFWPEFRMRGDKR